MWDFLFIYLIFFRHIITSHPIITAVCLSAVWFKKKCSELMSCTASQKKKKNTEHTVVYGAYFFFDYFSCVSIQCITSITLHCLLLNGVIKSPHFIFWMMGSCGFMVFCSNGEDVKYLHSELLILEINITCADSWLLFRLLMCPLAKVKSGNQPHNLEFWISHLPHVDLKW